LNLAEDKIKQGRFFLKRAEEIGYSDINAFRYYLEACIVTARSITFVLQKQYKHDPRFEEWYEEIKKRLASDDLARFLLTKRNFILKEGIVYLRKHINIFIAEAIEVNEAISIKVLGGSLKSRLRNSLVRLKNNLRQIFVSASRRIKKYRMKNKSNEIRTSVNLYFEESEWSKTPATDLIGRHLSNLESIVTECIQKFGKQE
jgi:hypothetical protein